MNKKTDNTHNGEVAAFASYSIAAGLRFGQFDHLSARDKSKLIRLMARIAEKSYRRGYQHGRLPLITGEWNIDPVVLRFDRSLDKSPYTDSPYMRHTSIERLFMECGELHSIGFQEPEHAIREGVFTPQNLTTTNQPKGYI
jgi:hypothetical protein